MPTLRELADQIDQRQFVGRDALLREFAAWLATDDPDYAVLNVTGHGGLGKTTLLRAFARLAAEQGRTVRFVDARDVTAPADLHAALGAQDTATCLDVLNDEGAVIVIDSLEANPLLEEQLLADVLPQLETTTRTVLASRVRVGDRASDDPMVRIIRECRLLAFTEQEATAYLQRRGITDPEVVSAVIGASQRNPLALSIAADLAMTSAGSQLGTTRDWHDAVRSLSERLLRHLPPAVARAIEAASLVRVFDEGLLAGMIDVPGDALRAVSGLSMVRPAERGLRLHDDVRAMVASDLRVRQPERYAELRSRALRCYRERMEGAPADERKWLVGERLYLWEDDFVRTALFPDQSASSDLIVEPAATADVPMILKLWDATAHEVHPAQGGAAHDDLDRDELQRLLAYPGTVMVARRAGGAILSAGVCAPVGADTLRLLPGIVRSVVDVYTAHGSGRALPPRAEDSDVRYYGPIFGMDAAGMSRLARWAIGRWIEGGTILVATAMPGFAALMEMLGFERLPGVPERAGKPTHALTLDLVPDDVERWIDRITATAPPLPESPAAPEPAWSVQLLGGFSVERGGHTVTPGGIAGMAVKHVALRPEGLPVEELVELLWPDTDAERGRTRLRNVLLRVREAAGELLVRDGDMIRLAPRVKVDALLVPDLVAQAAAALLHDPASAFDLAGEALEHDSADLLPGDRYVAAFDAPRERLRRAGLRAYDIRASAAERLGDLATALDALHAAIDADPYDEHRYLRAAGLLAAGGRSGPALRLVRRARAVVEDLDLPVSPELEKAERQLQR